MDAGRGQLAEQLRRLKLANPPVPFIIETTTGDRIDVNDGIRMAMNEVAVYVLHPKRGLTRIAKKQIASVLEKDQ